MADIAPTRSSVMHLSWIDKYEVTRAGLYLTPVTQ